MLAHSTAACLLPGHAVVLSLAVASRCPRASHTSRPRHPRCCVIDASATSHINSLPAAATLHPSQAETLSVEEIQRRAAALRQQKAGAEAKDGLLEVSAGPSNVGQEGGWHGAA